MAAAFVLVLSLAAQAGTLSMPAFSADHALTVDGRTSHGRLYSSGQRLRVEQHLESGTVVQILDFGANKSWTLMSPGGCVEQPLRPELVEKMVGRTFGGTANEEFLGEEAVEGRPTRKYRIHWEDQQGGRHVQYQWRATDLGGVPIRVADEKGTFEQRLTNVKLGSPEASLFEPPKDCRNLADFMKGLGGKRR
jgi:hypothetical protein